MKILFIGESWTVHMIHVKGYDSFTSSKYEEGARYLLDILKNKDVEVDYVPAHEVLIRFPKTLEELESYDSIVISDIGANSFLLQNSTFYEGEVNPNSLELIREYVSNGGGLLMIGGYLSFMGIEGKANYKNSPLNDVLPVEMLNGDDRVEVPQGVTPKTINRDGVLSGVENWPHFLGYNQFTPKEGTQVHATINNDPLLVFGTYGKGRTSCFASDCSPHWGTQAFLDWEYYGQLWMDILKSIKKGN